MFYGFGNLLCVMEITGTINTKKNEGDDMRVHFDSKSVYASASDFGWFWKVFPNHPNSPVKNISGNFIFQMSLGNHRRLNAIPSWISLYTRNHLHFSHRKNLTSGGSRISQRGYANPRVEGCQPIIWQKSCRKRHELDRGSVYKILLATICKGFLTNMEMTIKAALTSSLAPPPFPIHQC